MGKNRQMKKQINGEMDGWDEIDKYEKWVNRRNWMNGRKQNGYMGDNRKMRKMDNWGGN